MVAKPPATELVDDLISANNDIMQVRQDESLPRGTFERLQHRVIQTRDLINPFWTHDRISLEPARRTQRILDCQLMIFQ